MYINVWICLNISPENGSIRYGYCCTSCVIRMFLKNQSFATHSVNQIDKQAKMILSSNAANFVTNICFHSLLRLIEVL